jgi:hypothetical protein
MSRRISNILLIALLVALTGTALVYAERGNGRFGDRLTEEQREAIHARVRELREAGASREDIHEAVREMFEGYGIEIPKAPPGERPRGRGPSRTGHLGDGPREGKKWGEIKGSFE